jgi:hypothetical protein
VPERVIPDDGAPATCADGTLSSDDGCGLLDMPPLGSPTGPVVVQLQPQTGTACWEATFSAPHAKNDAARFVDKSDRSA